MQNANDKVKRAGFTRAHRWAACAWPLDLHDSPHNLRTNALHVRSSSPHLVSSYHQIIIPSYRHPQGKSVSRFWAKSQRKNRKSFLNPITKERNDLRFGENGVIFRGESAINTQKFVAPPKRAIFDLVLTFCSENFIKNIFWASKNQMSGIV